MASRRFRSQPALQRTGGSPRSALLGILVLAGIGLGAGALIGRLIHSAPPPAERIYAAAPRDQPAVPAPAGAPAETPPPPATVTPQREPQAIARPQPKPVLSSRPRRGPKVERAPAPAPPPAREETWAEQQQAYEKARAAYDADERAAGYRWAEQNKVRLQRYCRVAAQRTPAFLEGCLNYLKPRGAGVSHSPDQG